MSHALQAPLELTFGVEMEMLAFAPKERRADGVFWESTVREKIAKAIQEAGLGASQSEYCHDATYEDWFVTADSSLGYHSSERVFIDFAGVEIISPILLCGDAAAEHQISQVLNATKTVYPLVTDRSTGNHVHVGAHGLGFPFRTLRNLATIVTAFEHLINSVIPAARCGPPESCMTHPPSLNPKLFNKNVFQRIKRVNAVKDLDELRALWDEMAERMTSLSFEPVKTKGTVEFRWFDGTIDPTEVVTSARIAAGLVRFAHHVSDGELVDLLGQVRDPRFTIFSLMTEMGIVGVNEILAQRLRVGTVSGCEEPLHPLWGEFADKSGFDREWTIMLGDGRLVRRRGPTLPAWYGTRPSWNL